MCSNTAVAEADFILFATVAGPSTDGEVALNEYHGPSQFFSKSHKIAHNQLGTPPPPQPSRPPSCTLATLALQEELRKLTSKGNELDARIFELECMRGKGITAAEAAGIDVGDEPWKIDAPSEK